MGKQNHLFLVDPIAKLNLDLDTSLRLAEALHRRGHACFLAEPKHLNWAGGRKADVWCQQALFSAADKHVPTFGEMQKSSLADFNAIHVRKDPPYDMDYITMTWFLSSVEQTVKIYNSPQSLRNLNEKLCILQFPDAIIDTLVSADVDDLVHFLKVTAKGDAIIKPLTMYGGKGISRLDLSAISALEAERHLAAATANGEKHVMIQRFNPDVLQGEVRVFTVGGEPIAWCLKKPRAGEYLANSNFGSTRHLYQPSAAEDALIRQVATELRAAGVEVIGFDVIGGLISEINITSPRLLTHESDQTRYFEQFAEWIIKDAG